MDSLVSAQLSSLFTSFVGLCVYSETWEILNLLVPLQNVPNLEVENSKSSFQGLNSSWKLCNLGPDSVSLFSKGFNSQVALTVQIEQREI